MHVARDCFPLNALSSEECFTSSFDLLWKKKSFVVSKFICHFYKPFKDYLMFCLYLVNMYNPLDFLPCSSTNCFYNINNVRKCLGTLIIVDLQFSQGSINSKKKIKTMQTHLCHISSRNLAKNVRPISHVILVVTHQYPSLRHIS